MDISYCIGQLNILMKYQMVFLSMVEPKKQEV